MPERLNPITRTGVVTVFLLGFYLYALLFLTLHLSRQVWLAVDPAALQSGPVQIQNAILQYAGVSIGLTLFFLALSIWPNRPKAQRHPFLTPAQQRTWLLNAFVGMTLAFNGGVVLAILAARYPGNTVLASYIAASEFLAHHNLLSLITLTLLNFTAAWMGHTMYKSVKRQVVPKEQADC